MFAILFLAIRAKKISPCTRQFLLRTLARLRLRPSFNDKFQNLLAEVVGAVHLFDEVEAEVKKVGRIEPLRLPNTGHDIERRILHQNSAELTERVIGLTRFDGQIVG